jgi:hypothetical protein
LRLTERKTTYPMKVCSKCAQRKDNCEFHTRRASADGLALTCKQCVNDNSRTWRLKHPSAHREWYQQNKDNKAKYWSAWRERNIGKLSASYKRWATLNKGKKNALVAKRVSIKKSAVAPWINRDAVRAIYAEAARLTESTGILHEVDHIVPLQGKNVCGLHWEGNLQILTKTENIRKSNRFDASNWA